jgi:WD40 repeat protein
LTFSPNGAFLLSGVYKSVVVRSAKDGSIVRTLSCDLSQVHDLAFSPDGKTLAVAGGTPGASGGVQLFEWKGGKGFLALREHSDVVTSVAFSLDGTQLATASADKTVRVHNLTEGGKGFLALRGHAGSVLTVAFSPDGETIVTASADRSIKVWEAKTGKLLHSFSNHTGIVHCIAFRPNTQHAFCASGSDDKTVRVWQPQIGRMVRIVRGHEGAILAVVYSRDGSKIFSAGTEGVIRVVDADSDEILQRWKAHDGWIYSLAVSPDGKTLASGDSAGQVKLWDAAKWSQR